MVSLSVFSTVNESPATPVTTSPPAASRHAETGLIEPILVKRAQDLVHAPRNSPMDSDSDDLDEVPRKTCNRPADQGVRTFAHKECAPFLGSEAAQGDFPSSRFDPVVDVDEDEGLGHVKDG